MDDFADTPFARLKGLSLPEKNRKEGALSGAKPAARPGSGRPDSPEADEDARLFLSAMQNVSPSRKAKPAGDDTLFLSAMERSGLGPKKGKASRVRPSARAGAGKAAPSPVTGESPLPDSAAPATPAIPGSGLGAQQNNRKQPKGGTSGLPPEFPAAAEDDEGFSALLAPEGGQPDLDLFDKAMNGVAPLAARGREVPRKRPVPAAATGGRSPAVIMQEILNGRIEFALHNTREYLEGSVVGVDPHVVARLKAGALSPEAHIDLHGLNAEQARESLSAFIQNAYQRNMRTVLVITGRGKNSPEGFAVLRNLISVWLTHEPFKRVVLAFCSARQTDGGLGALYVLLRKYRKSLGKIQWDIPQEI